MPEQTDHDRTHKPPRRKRQRRLPIPQLRTELKQRAFLEAVVEYLDIKKACSVAKIARATFYGEWLKDEEFQKQYAEASEHACDRAEGEAFRRAVHGTRKPVFHKGRPCGFIQEYSDGLLMFFLKAKRPQIYRDKVDHEISFNHEAYLASKTVEATK